MSNKRYEVNTPGVSPVDRDVTKLLYVSTAKYGGDWHSLMHTHAVSYTHLTLPTNREV